jgi:hypothetical protein
VELLELLSKKEITEFKNVLKNNKNNRLLLLLNNINLIEKDKDKLYKTIFNKPRNKKNDYLLRNEIRLLKNELKYFFACKYITHINQESEHILESLYLKELVKRKSGLITIKEAESIIEKLHQRNDIEKLCEIIPIYIKEKIYFFNPDVTIFNNLLKQLDYLDDAYEKIMHRKILENEYIKAYLHKTNKQSGLVNKYTFPEKLLTKYADDIAEYYKLKTLSLIVNDNERLNVLIQIKTLLKKIRLPKSDLNKEKAALYTNIGLEYSFKLNHEEAIKYLNEAIKLKKHIPDTNYTLIIYNYISILLKTGKYSEALNIIEVNIKHFKKNKTLLFRLNILRIIALVYHGAYKQAQKEIPVDFKQGTFHDYIYLRCLLAIIFFETRKTDLSARELKNIMQTMRNKEWIDNHVEFCKIMQEIINLYNKWNSLNINTQKNSLAELKNKLDLKKYTRQNMLLMMWIYNNIDRIFEQKKKL